MPDISTLALAAWLVFTFALFARLLPRRAILVAVIGGALLLPITAVAIPGPLPDLDKSTAILAGVLLGILVFDRDAFLRVRLAWVDVPIIVWVLSPFLSSLANGLGVYDGISAVLENLLAWGIPYWLGRVYFFEAQALNDLAWGIFIGGLLYVPLCWFEIVNGPYLHFYLYRIYPDAALEAFRFGGWRPIVFLEHGLQVALWMTAASVSGIVLLLSGALARWGRWPGAAAVLVLVVTTFALKSVNAWVLLAFVSALLLVSVRLRRPWLVWTVMGVPLLYLGARTVLGWYAFELAYLVELVLPGKKNSVLFRLVNEIQIAERAWLQPIWGWGRWGRAFIGREGGLPVLTPDSMWIAALGQQGFLGLLAFLSVVFLPPFLFTLREPAAQWLSPRLAPVTACAFVVLVFALDSLVNSMMLPAYLIAAGGVVGWFILSGQVSVEP